MPGCVFFFRTSNATIVRLLPWPVAPPSTFSRNSFKRVPWNPDGPLKQGRKSNRNRSARFLDESRESGSTRSSPGEPGGSMIPNKESRSFYVVSSQYHKGGNRTHVQPVWLQCDAEGTCRSFWGMACLGMTPS